MPYEAPKTGRGPRYDLTNPANINQDFGQIADMVADMAARKWGNTQAASGLGFHGDSQIATMSRCSTTAMIQGIFRKQALETVWANGGIITITDSGASVGDKDLEWHEGARRNGTQDLGLVAMDQPPERAIGLATTPKYAKFHRVAHLVELGFHEMAQAQRAGYDRMRVKGEELRDQHMFDMNTLIRAGMPKAGLRGITNYPGIHYKSAVSNWGTAAAGVIYDEFNEAIDLIYDSESEEPEPEICVLGRKQRRHFRTEQFSPGGTDTTLEEYIKRNSSIDFVLDSGMRSADTFGHPGALFLTPSPDLIRVTAPVFAQVQAPQESGNNPWVITIEIWSYFAGVQITNTESVCFVDGAAAGWSA